jgi:hypothetical protein
MRTGLRRDVGIAAFARFLRRSTRATGRAHPGAKTGGSGVFHIRDPPRSWCAESICSWPGSVVAHSVFSESLESARSDFVCFFWSLYGLPGVSRRRGTGSRSYWDQGVLASSAWRDGAHRRESLMAESSLSIVGHSALAAPPWSHVRSSPESLSKKSEAILLLHKMKTKVFLFTVSASRTRSIIDS